ncbi:MAG: methyltransferase domain-containing protein [Candidatus Pacebacteria bacterium]|nr:methyltransferase domain-containing protein [Candidatus Paceibacterota bacterium]
MSFTDPQNNIDQFDLDKGMIVADLGAGIGSYSIVIAKKVGDEGKVYAVEVQKELLSKISHLAGAEHLFNVETVWGDIEKIGGTKLGDASVDAVVISNVLFQTENKDNLIKEAYRILRDGRKVLVIEWIDSAGGLGPLDEQVLSSGEVKDIFLKNFFELEKDIDAGDNHYGLIFRKKQN